MAMKTLNLLPCPRSLRLGAGSYTLPKNAVLHLDPALPRDSVLLPVAERLQAAAAEAGVSLELVSGPPRHPRLAIRAARSSEAPAEAEGYRLDVTKTGVLIRYRTEGGLRAGVATLRQLLRQCGQKLPTLAITDFPDFARRGVMLDTSRGRVPSLQTLLDLVDDLADFKINEFQLYTEHTFAYRGYEPVWSEWGPLTGEDILVLDARCRSLGIDLVPNQNSFGHLRYWLEYPPLRKLAEISEPYEGADGTYLRYPSTLAPTHRGTLPFLRGLYDELLPHFTSGLFNVGCDETWDLGRGQSKAACDASGKGRVYVDFLKQIHKEVSKRDRKMMFWGDIILHHPELLKDLPRDIFALNWGYEINHPFERETALFAKSRIPFYVSPGTSTWMTLIGRHDNAFENLRLAAGAGRKNGATGFLNTDWGDGGHPQPLAVSYLPYLVGASVSWCASAHEPKALGPVLSRDVFRDSTGRLAEAAMKLGLAHLKFKYKSPNVTPFGIVIAAPIPRTRELMCRDGLKLYARIEPKNIRAALEEVETQRRTLAGAQPGTGVSRILAWELDLAARMAAESCHLMLWQQTLAAGKTFEARKLARRGIQALTELGRDFNRYWPLRNKGTTAKCSAFLRWRTDDYRRAALHFPPDLARIAKPKTYAAD